MHDYNRSRLVYLELQDDVLQVLHHLNILLQLLVFQRLQNFLEINCTSEGREKEPAKLSVIIMAAANKKWVTWTLKAFHNIQDF